MIPIHTEAKEKIKEYTDKAVILEDGEIYEVKEWTQKMAKHEIITYNELMERLKNVPLEQYTPEDIFHRYIAYGTVAELNNITIQSLIIKNGYTEYLVNILGEMTTNESIIAEMLKSGCFNKDYSIKRGTIEDIQLIKIKELPSTFVGANITLVDAETKQRCFIQYVDDEDKINAQFKRAYTGKYITVVVQVMESLNRLCCFLNIK